MRYGRSGIEAELNDELTGQATDLGVQTWVDQLLGRRPKGADVKLTLVPAVQKVAQQSLHGHDGRHRGARSHDRRADRLGLRADLRPGKTLEDEWARLSKDPARRC